MTEVLCQKIFKTSNEETLLGTKLKLSARLEIMEEREREGIVNQEKIK